MQPRNSIDWIELRVRDALSSVCRVGVGKGLKSFAKLMGGEVQVGRREAEADIFR